MRRRASTRSVRHERSEQAARARRGRWRRLTRARAVLLAGASDMFPRRSDRCAAPPVATATEPGCRTGSLREAMRQASEPLATLVRRRDDRPGHPRRPAPRARADEPTRGSLRRPAASGRSRSRGARRPSPLTLAVSRRPRRDRCDGAGRRCGDLRRASSEQAAAGESDRRRRPRPRRRRVPPARRAAGARVAGEAEHRADRVPRARAASCSPWEAAAARRSSFAGSSERPRRGRTSAWVVAPGSAPVRAARFVGTERAVFLTRPLGPRASVVVSTESTRGRVADAEPHRRGARLRPRARAGRRDRCGPRPTRAMSARSLPSSFAR